MAGGWGIIVIGGTLLIVALSTQAGATIYQCRDRSGGVIYTDSQAQLEHCSPLTTEGAGPPSNPGPPPLDPNVPLIQMPTKPGSPPEFVPATDLDPETNPFTITKIFPQVEPPKMSPDQVGTPEALPPQTFPQPSSEAATAAPPPGARAQTKEPQQGNPIRSFNPFFPILPTVPSAASSAPTP